MAFEGGNGFSSRVSLIEARVWRTEGKDRWWIRLLSLQ